MSSSHQTSEKQNLFHSNHNTQAIPTTNNNNNSHKNGTTSNHPTLFFFDTGLIDGLEASTGKIYIGFPDGREMKAIVHNLALPDGIDIDKTSGRIFWTNMGHPRRNDGSVMSCKLDGSDIQTIIAKGKIHTPKQLTIDHQNNKLYISDREGLRVHRCNLDGSNHEILIRTGDFASPSDIADATKWCVDIPDGQTAENRTDIELLFDGLPEPIDLDIDLEAKVLHWTDRGNFPICCSVNRSFVGSQSKLGEGGNKGSMKKMPEWDILQGHFHEPIGLKIDWAGGKVYVTDLGGSVYEMNLDGTGKRRIYESEWMVFTGISLAYL